MKRVMQFRYYGVDNDANYPNYSGVNYLNKLLSGNLFDNYDSISQLGIQGPPGVIFYLNNGSNPIMIGKTGIYELDLKGIGRIFSIQFDSKTLSKDFDGRLIIDIVYEGG